MQEFTFDSVRILFSREKEPAAIYMEYNNIKPEYPSSFLSVVKIWKRLVIKEGVCPETAVIEGSGTGASVVLAACLWSRDHGVGIPASIVLTDPCLEISGTGADSDDPCAFPLEADYYGFPDIEIRITEGYMYESQVQELCNRLSEQGISFCLKKITV